METKLNQGKKKSWLTELRERKKAIVYIRMVLHDQPIEQWRNDFYMRRLRQYCKANKLRVVGYFEDAQLRESLINRSITNEFVKYIEENNGSFEYIVYSKRDAYLGSIYEADDFIKKKALNIKTINMDRHTLINK